MQSEHERYLTEKHVRRPVIVTDYPKAKDYILLALQYDPNLPEAYTILAQLEKIPPGDKAPAP